MTTERDNLEKQLCICERQNINQDALHCIHLQIWGIRRWEEKNSELNYKELHLKLPPNEDSELFSVPKKIPIASGYTPYEYIDNKIIYNGSPIFNNKPVIEVPLPEKDKPRYLKGYSFPFWGTKSPYYELRLNPKNTGRCPGKCLFCHRGYSTGIKLTQTKDILLPEELLNVIINNHGIEVFDHVSHISIITELFGKEDLFLNYIGNFKNLLNKTVGESKTKFGGCAQDIRSKEGLRKLYTIIDEKRYSFTLEVFENRSKIMGKYKALPLEDIIIILKNARKIGFDEIKLNYIAGIDSFLTFKNWIRIFRDLKLIDTIGLSIFTAFFPGQLKLRHHEAWDIEYYLKIIDLVKELNIRFYKSNCFEMGYPLQLLQ